MFPPEQLQPITAPTWVYVGERDEELSPADNAIALVREMPAVARLQTIPDAGHFTFLAPCSPQLSRSMPALCVDRKGVDRVAIHREINAEVAAFFSKMLAVSQPN